MSKQSRFLVIVVLAAATLPGCAQWTDFRSTIKAERHFERGARYLDKGLHDLGEKEFRAAVEARPQAAHLPGRIGIAYLQVNRRSLAIPYLQKAVDLEPGQPVVVYHALFAHYDREGDFPKCEEVLRQAVRYHPNDPDALNNLGYIYADRGIHLDLALELLKKAVKLAPNKGYIIDSLGWAYYRKGQLDQALPLLQRAVHLQPDAVIHHHLGIVHRDLGKYQEAIEQFERALSVDPGHRESRGELKKLRKHP